MKAAAIIACLLALLAGCDFHTGPARTSTIVVTAYPNPPIIV